MDLREFIRKNYDLVRESGSFGMAVMIHVAMFVVFCFVTFTTSASVRKAVIGALVKEAPTVVEMPKPVVSPSESPVSVSLAPGAPGAGGVGGPAGPARPDGGSPGLRQNLMKGFENKITVKSAPSTFSFKAISAKEQGKLNIRVTTETGKSIRGALDGAWSKKWSGGSGGGGSGVGGGGGGGRRGPRACIKNFVVIQYQGGDWDCEFHHSGGGIVFGIGSIPNLVHELRRKTNIEVINETSIVVRADSPDITNSPFVYFTGHQNFTLTEAEVDNLRTYLLQGFAIVANSSLPGRRSRFDVAFRREMKRVMPDHELEPITKDHGLFSAFYKFERVPVGVNYWQEPVEVIAIDGRVVVIYNLNDYGDLMLARLSDDYKTIRAGWRVDISKDAKGKEIITPLDATWEGPRVYSQWTRRRNLYAGCEDVQTVIDAFNININILAYLLTR